MSRAYRAVFRGTCRTTQVKQDRKSGEFDCQKLNKSTAKESQEILVYEKKEEEVLTSSSTPNLKSIVVILSCSCSGIDLKGASLRSGGYKCLFPPPPRPRPPLLFPRLLLYRSL